MPGSGHVVEAGVDDFEVYEGQPINTTIINQLSAKINAYPNPFSESMKIDYELNSNNGTLEVFNLVGQTVETHAINNKEGSILIGNNLETGIYFVRIIQNGQVSTAQKVVKIK
ncbi:MAG: T9SS type A sorting domain-containing protein [Saprospiraceae bacterium]|nr:T9SS type A sorting domain-containing protein [Saprospiraceae bacterium]